MACAERSLVSGAGKLPLVLDRPECGHPISYAERPCQVCMDISRCDIVSDQADGARGPEQALCSKPQSCALCQAIIKIGRLPARGGTETGR